MFNDLLIITISSILKSLILIVLLLVAVAYFTLIERKIMASIQRRKGPNVVGWFGLLQAVADGLKLLIKESVIPNNANSIDMLQEESKDAYEMAIRSGRNQTCLN